MYYFYRAPGVFKDLSPSITQTATNCASWLLQIPDIWCIACHVLWWINHNYFCFDYSYTLISFQHLANSAERYTNVWDIQICLALFLYRNCNSKCFSETFSGKKKKKRDQLLKEAKQKKKQQVKLTPMHLGISQGKNNKKTKVKKYKENNRKIL